ncbi:hypothetical protein HD806DRAFT_533147 [Xylariaceae sp. AK1471]|nr:hypothetical protein HD806DRAFT_533147 [Xylariaceae sp. AK1471]
MFGGSVIGEDYATVESVKDLLKSLQSPGIGEIDTADLYPVPTMGDTKILVLSKDANGTLEPAKIEKSLSESRERLRFDASQKVGVLHCHAPDFTTPLKDQAAVLNSLHQQRLFDKV